MRTHRRFFLAVLLVSAAMGAQLVAASPTAGPMEFTQINNYAVGANPMGITSADFNNDADVDLAVVNYLGNTLRILRGNGNGGFNVQAAISTGSNPADVAAGDFNNDNTADLAVTNLASGTTSILLGVGDGTFSFGTTLTGGSYGIDSGYFNNDGILDLAVPNYGSDNISLFLGNGDGTFSFGTTLTAGSAPYAVAARDLTGDGKSDVVSTNFAGDSVSVFRGNGSGGFSLTASVTVGDEPRAIAVGDVNSDGNQDLAVANGAASNISVLSGNGSGGFSRSATLTAGGTPYDVQLQDLNGDGDLDLASSDNNNSVVRLFRGNGAGTFTEESSPSVSNAGWLVFDYFDSDTKPDLAVGEWGDNEVFILKNRTLCAATLNLITSASPVAYGNAKTLYGLLMSGGRTVPNRGDVQVWKRTAFDTIWHYDGTLPYDKPTGLYVSGRGLTSNTTFALRCPGDGEYVPTISDPVFVRVYAYLTAPTLSAASPRRNVNFTASGTLRPRHSTPGSTRQYFYRKVLGRWRYYKSVACGLTNYPTYTRYAATTKLPYAGSWYVKAYHADASHAATWSSPRYFTVR